jgi:hypothetical protein
MASLTVPEKTAKAGVRATTNQFTQIQVRMASLELLVGGPFKDHPYGHTALRVTTKDQDIVFDYGRYRNTWGLGSSEGEGILNVWNDFNAYIKEENSFGRITTGFVYETSEENARNVLRFYDQKISGKPVLGTTRLKKIVHIDTYNALGPNCTTLSVAAAKTIFPNIDQEWPKYQQGRGLGMMEKAAVSAKGWPKFIFMPADLQEMLGSPNARKAKKVNKYGGQR